MITHKTGISTGTPVRVYYNARRKKFSIERKVKGKGYRVVASVDSVDLTDARPLYIRRGKRPARAYITGKLQHSTRATSLSENILQAHPGQFKRWARRSDAAQWNGSDFACLFINSTRKPTPYFCVGGSDFGQPGTAIDFDAQRVTCDAFSLGESTATFVTSCGQKYTKHVRTLNGAELTALTTAMDSAHAPATLDGDLNRFVPTCFDSVEHVNSPRIEAEGGGLGVEGIL